MPAKQDKLLVRYPHKHLIAKDIMRYPQIYVLVCSRTGYICKDN